MRRLIIALLATALCSAQAQRARIRNVDFFGTGGLDVGAVRTGLSVHNGDNVSEDQIEVIRDRLSRAVQNRVGHKPTDIAFMCCDDRGGLSIYVGLGGSNTAALSLLPPPVQSTCLPVKAVDLYEDATAAVERAIEQGHGDEDDSRGYSLSADPAARAKQLSIHDYAAEHEREIGQALRGCSNSKQRRAAAELLGYAPSSAFQVAALVRASHDPDEEVRNNAVRALWIIAESHSAPLIPGNDFVVMLNSSSWTDRNKAGMLLLELTRSRDPELLQHLRSEALLSLIEMAQWDDPAHAYAYQVILGRIAGLKEEQIQQLIKQQKVGRIIATARAVGAPVPRY